jgi:hypothetical protein
MSQGKTENLLPARPYGKAGLKTTLSFGKEVDCWEYIAVKHLARILYLNGSHFGHAGKAVFWWELRG